MSAQAHIGGDTHVFEYFAGAPCLANVNHPVSGEVGSRGVGDRCLRGGSKAVDNLNAVSVIWSNVAR